MIAEAQTKATLSLTGALAILDRIEPVEPRVLKPNEAIGRTLAEDARTDAALRLTGARLRRIDAALLETAGIDRVVVRIPHILIARQPAAREGNPIVALLGGTIGHEGGVSTAAELTLATALESARKDPNIDAVIAIGVVPELTRIGRIEFEQVALSPGGTVAFGYADSRPVLALPGELPAALSAWLTLGRRLLARLSFRLIEDQPFLLELARPIASARGMAEVLPVRRRAAQIEPLPNDAWSPQSIARADGWILVPAETESLPAGTKVQMRPWP